MVLFTGESGPVLVGFPVRVVPIMNRIGSSFNAFSVQDKAKQCAMLTKNPKMPFQTLTSLF